MPIKSLLLYCGHRVANCSSHTGCNDIDPRAHPCHLCEAIAAATRRNFHDVRLAILPNTCLYIINRRLHVEKGEKTLELSDFRYAS